MLRMLGLACYGFGIVDLASYWLGIADITGVSWSPIVAFVAGSMLVKAADNAGATSAPQAPNAAPKRS